MKNVLMALIMVTYVYMVNLPLIVFSSAPKPVSIDSFLQVVMYNKKIFLIMVVEALIYYSICRGITFNWKLDRFFNMVNMVGMGLLFFITGYFTVNIFN